MSRENRPLRTFWCTSKEQFNLYVYMTLLTYSLLASNHVASLATSRLDSSDIQLSDLLTAGP